METAADPACQLAQHTGNETWPARQAAGQRRRTTAAAVRALETLEESQECRERRIVLYQRGKEVYLEEKVIKQNSGGRTPVISVTGDNTGEKKKMPQVEEEAGLWKGEGDGSVKMSPERKVKETRRREGSR